MELIALIIWPLFFVSSIYMFMLSGFDFAKHSYSDLGSHKIYGFYFNLILICTGLIQILFLSEIFTIRCHNCGLGFNFGLVFLMITTLTGILTGIITKRQKENIHNLIACIGFLCSIVGYTTLGFFFVTKNPVISLYMLLWGLGLMPYTAFKYFKTKSSVAKREVYMFLGGFITNILLLALFY